MKRLFVGLPVTPSFAGRLSHLQPEADKKIRPTLGSQMHVTVQFIGRAEAEPIAKALQHVAGESFPLAVTQLGQFGSPRRGGILWLGVAIHPRLAALRADTIAALAPLGIEPDPRAFTPHITLARYRRGTPRNAVDAFLRQQLPPFPPLEVREFVLYASRQASAGSVYTPEGIFELGGQ
ncbi:MAG: RNA 2',3'-cyclic phosphodiesterase [Cellvibrionaceae bacterium]